MGSAMDMLAGFIVRGPLGKKASEYLKFKL
jgi:hypothetical protein